MSMHVVMRVIRLVLGLMVLVGCSTAAAPDGADTTTPAPQSSSRLVIYSGRSEALIQPVIAAFQATYPRIEVSVKAGKNSELAAAILEEKANPQADLFISTDMLTHINLRNEGVFAPAPIAGSESVPANLKASDGSWTSITSRARVIMYNTTLVSAAEAPQSMLDLTDPKWKGKIAAANSTNGSMQAQVAMMNALIGTEATQAWLAGLVANETTFFGGHTDVRKAVGAGEFAIGIVNHYYYELQKREASDNQVGVVYPDQGAGQMGVMINTTVVGQIQGAPNAENARLFAEFMFTKQAQQLFAEANYEYPMIAGVTLAAGVTPLDTLRLAVNDMAQVATGVDTALQLLNAAGIP